MMLYRMEFIWSIADVLVMSYRNAIIRSTVFKPFFIKPVR